MSLGQLATAAVSTIKGFSSARTSIKFLIGIIALILPIAVVLLVSNLKASPTVITVDSISDGSSAGICTLRAAIDSANNHTPDGGTTCVAGTGDDLIDFNLSGDIMLASTLTVTNTSPNSLTIDGTGQTISIDGQTSVQPFSVSTSATTLNLNDLTITNGKALGGGGGVVNSGTLTVNDCTFSSNHANAIGGAINNSGTLIVSNSTFSSNSATGALGGGAIYNAASDVLGVTNSTFSGNSADDGAAIISDGIASITNSTFASNTASSGDAVTQSGSGSVTITNSILGTNSTGNCGGTITNGGFNISKDGTCIFGTSTGANGDTIGDNIDPLLEALANYGGPTQTIALMMTSPAIAAVPIDGCPLTDQRGYPRPAAGEPQNACDIGAFEFSPIIVNTLLDDTTNGDGKCSLPKAINNANSGTTDTTDGDCTIGTDIVFSVSGEISISGGPLPAITGTVGVDGSGQTITVSGGNTNGLFGVNLGGSLMVSNLTIANGTTNVGGAIDNNGTTSVNDVTFTGNSAAEAGGAIFNDGTSLTISNSTFANNTQTVSDVANDGGGAIFTEAGVTTITGSTFSTNTASSNGGAIYADNTVSVTATTLNVTNSTFSQNSASFSGGAVVTFGSATASIKNSTIAGNSASGGSFGGGVNNASSGTFTVENSIIANSVRRQRLRGDHHRVGGVPNIADDNSVRLPDALTARPALCSETMSIRCSIRRV